MALFVDVTVRQSQNPSKAWDFRISATRFLEMDTSIRPRLQKSWTNDACANNAISSRWLFIFRGLHEELPNMHRFRACSSKQAGGHVTPRTQSSLCKSRTVLTASRSQCFMAKSTWARERYGRVWVVSSSLHCRSTV